jgi:hypothetical protein
MRDLPIYKLTINDSDTSESEVNFIALVDEPAIERNFLTFSNKLQFTTDKERQIVSGPAMIADLPIYRRDEKYGEYYVVFDKETIEKIVLKFMRKGYTGNVNLMHDSTKIVDGVYVFESFIIDKDRGIKPPKGFDDLTDGSWYVSMKVDNMKLWDNMKLFNGFSVEGVFEYQSEDEEIAQMISQIIQEAPKNTL